MQDVAMILVKKPKVACEVPVCTSSICINHSLTGKEGHRTKTFTIIFYVHESGFFSCLRSPEEAVTNSISIRQAFKLSDVADPGNLGHDQVVHLGML